jgi:hypothetical protein
VASLVELYLQTRTFQNKNEAAACHEKALTGSGNFARYSGGRRVLFGPPIGPQSSEARPAAIWRVAWPALLPEKE